jgi:hypothetical protein
MAGFSSKSKIKYLDVITTLHVAFVSFFFKKNSTVKTCAREVPDLSRSPAARKRIHSSFSWAVHYEAARAPG